MRAISIASANFSSIFFCCSSRYADTTYDHSDAVIDEDILQGVPQTVEFTVSGHQIVTWRALD